MEIRKAHSRDMNTYIDCYIQHKKHGWIPFTSRKDDDTADVYNFIISKEIPVSIAPSKYHQWIDDQWVLNTDILEIVKNQKLDEINTKRDEFLAAGFEYAGNYYNSDDKSIQNILGLVTQVSLNQEYTTSYITKDNQTVQLSANDISAMAQTALTRKEAVYSKARLLKDLVLSAATIEEVESIEWEGL